MTQSEKYYDLLASEYNEATGKDGAWTPPNIIYEKIKNHLSKDSLILDVGIGTGHSIKKIYDSGNYLEIYGVDVSENMLAICEDNFPNVQLTKISSIADLATFDIDCDIIICSGVLEFIENVQVFFAQSRGILKKTGVLILTYEPIIHFHPIQSKEKSLTVSSVDSKYYVDNFYTYRYNPSQFNTILMKHGFSISSDEEFVAYRKSDKNIIYHVIKAGRI